MNSSIIVLLGSVLLFYYAYRSPCQLTDRLLLVLLAVMTSIWGMVHFILAFFPLVVINFKYQLIIVSKLFSGSAVGIALSLFVTGGWKRLTTRINK